MAYLTYLKIKSLKTPGRYPDGGGLYLNISKNGKGSWTFRYNRFGRSKELGLGSIRDVPLAEARKQRDRTRVMIFKGLDPIIEKQKKLLQLKRSLDQTFEWAANEYINTMEIQWKNIKHRMQWRSTLKTYAYPIIGETPLNQIATQHILKILKPIWSTKTETATRVRQRIEAILNWSITLQYSDPPNPATWKGHLENLLPKPNKIRTVKHHLALFYEELPSFFTNLQNIKAPSSYALQFLILTAARTSEVRGATWDEIDEKNKLWIIPGSRMKTGREHVIPLTDNAFKTLLWSNKRNPTNNLFYNYETGKPLSEMAMLSILRKSFASLGIVTHGFRSTFRDWAEEMQTFSHRAIEECLSHSIKNKTEAAYLRTNLLKSRRIIMDEWSKFIFGGNSDKF